MKIELTVIDVAACIASLDDSIKQIEEGAAIAKKLNVPIDLSEGVNAMKCAKAKMVASLVDSPKTSS